MKRCKHNICSLFLLYFLANRSFAEELTLNVNFRQPIAVTDEKFLSLTLDPAALFHGNALSTDFEKSVNLAKALSPAYIRLGGEHGTFYQSADQGSESVEKTENLVLTESEWVAAHNWAEKAGLNVIACIAPDNIARKEQRDSESLEDAGNIVSFSNHMGFNTSWQIGYECQNRCNISGTELASQLVILRKVLDKFPRYSSSLIVGPDVIGYKTDKQRQYLRDYFSIAAPALSVITWHPDLNSVTLDNEGVLIREDTLDKDKEELFRVIGRFSKKKPLWIAESKPEECKNLYLAALVSARRLGNAAKLKVNVVMRQPTDLIQPTPDYWVSLLHKTLVGREVFDARVQSLNKSHVYLYCQCTRASNRYQRGSVTIFGVNLSPENVRMDLKGAKITTLHEYILSPGFDAPNRMFAESVLLNNESLSLVNDTVPDLEPVVLYNSKGLELDLQSGGIGFWVLPELRIKACMEVRESPELQTSRTSAQISQGLRKRIDDPKARFTRSTRDRETTKTEQKREGREGNTSRVTRKSDARKELRRLKRFVKRKLSDYDTRKSIVEDSFDSKTENRAIRQSKTDELSEQLSQDDMNAKLEDFKNRLSGFGNLKNPLGAVVAKAMTLIFNVQNALEKEKSETDDTSKGFSRDAVRSYLQLLFDVLTNVTLPELSDLSESQEGKDQRAKRARRDLLKTEPARRDLLKTEPTLNLKRESLLQRRSKLENTGDQRDQTLIKEEDFKIRPKVVHLGTSDSGEQTFYGFFKTKPIKGFPEGDVFFRTDVRRRSDHGYRRVGYYGSHYDDPEDNNSEGDNFEDDDHEGNDPEGDNPEDDNPESPEIMEDPSEPEVHVTSGDIWDIETLERRRNAEIETQKESRVKRMPGKAKLIHQGSKMWDLNEDSVSEDTDLPTKLQLFRSKRSRRDPDLHAILAQEMVKEDDANSKDCKCRVIRSKRQSPESVEQKTIDRVSQDDATGNPNPEELETHDVEDVEVFSGIEGPPMEILREQTEASNVKERKAEMNLLKVGEPLQGEAKLDPEEIEASNSGDISSDSPLNSLEELENSTPARLSRESAISGLTEMSGLNTEGQSLTTLVNEDSTFFRGESGRSEEKRAAVNTYGTAAEYPSSSRESLATKETDTRVKEAKEVSGAEASGATLGSSLSGASIAEAEASGPTLEFTLSGTESSDPTLGSSLSGAGITRAEASGTTPESSLSGASIAGAEASDPALESTLPGVEAPSATLGSTLPKAEASGATLKSALFEKRIAGAEDDYDNNKFARGSLKRHAQEPILKIRGVESGESKVSRLSASRRNIRRDRIASRKKPTSETKPWEGRLLENTKLLMTLKKILDERKGEVRDSIKLGSAGRNRENQRNRLDQFQKLRSLLRDRRQRLQSVSRDEAEDDAEEEMRTLKRREALEMIKDNNDRENSGFEMIEPDTTGKSMEKRELSATEIVRPRNVREKILNLKHSSNFHDQAIMEHSNPSDLAEIIDLKNLYENEGTRGERSSEDKEEEGRSYFALVEDLENPKIFHYHKPQQQKRSAQVSPLFRVSEYVPRYKTYRKSIEVIQDPNEENEADELLEDQEIYIIDPSTYRGGQPTLQLYSDPSNLRKTDQILIADEYEPILKPILYKSYRIRQTEPHKREDSEAINVQRQSDQGAQVTKLQDSPRNLNVNELLRILINSLDLRTAEELFRRLTGESTASVEKQNLVGSISEQSGEEQSSKDGGEREEDEQGQEEQRASEISDTRVKEKRESYQEPSMGTETNEDDTDSGASVAPKDDRSPEEYFNVEGVTEVRKRRNTDQSEVLRVLPWAKKLGRQRRQAVGQETVGESVEKIQPLKLQQLEEVSSPRIPTYIDDVEKSIAQKKHVEMHAEQKLANYINDRQRKSNEDLGFSSFLQESIPRLQNVVVDGLKKAQSMTNSMEQLIENVNEFNETSKSSEEKDSFDLGSPNATQNTFYNAIMQVKKFFMFLTGIAHVLHG